MDIFTLERNILNTEFFRKLLKLTVTVSYARKTFSLVV